MQEYLNLGHITEIEEYHNDEELSYYLPHHAVIPASSCTTKIGIVFDDSMKTDQNDLISILLRFRMFTFS